MTSGHERIPVDIKARMTGLVEAYLRSDLVDPVLCRPLTGMRGFAREQRLGLSLRIEPVRHLLAGQRMGQSGILRDHMAVAVVRLLERPRSRCTRILRSVVRHLVTIAELVELVGVGQAGTFGTGGRIRQGHALVGAVSIRGRPAFTLDACARRSAGMFAVQVVHLVIGRHRSFSLPVCPAIFAGTGDGPADDVLGLVRLRSGHDAETVLLDSAIMVGPVRDLGLRCLLWAPIGVGMTGCRRGTLRAAGCVAATEFLFEGSGKPHVAAAGRFRGPARGGSEVGYAGYPRVHRSFLQCRAASGQPAGLLPLG